MDTYTFLRQFADSWFLIAMFAFFIGVSVRAFLPSQRQACDEAAAIPLKDDPNDCHTQCAHRTRHENALSEVQKNV